MIAQFLPAPPSPKLLCKSSFVLLPPKWHQETGRGFCFPWKWDACHVQGPVARSGVLPTEIPNCTGFLPDKIGHDLEPQRPLECQMPPPSWHQEIWGAGPCGWQDEATWQWGVTWHQVGRGRVMPWGSCGWGGGVTWHRDHMEVGPCDMRMVTWLGRQGHVTP